jgi:putative peptide zinc metalloprotease protein
MAIDTGHAGAPGSRTLPPRLADGVELLGEFEDSGFESPPHLARRSDGQVIQLTELLHLVAEAADGTRDEAQIADIVSERFGRRVSADNVAVLVEQKLRPLGVLAAADGSSPRLRKADPLLALKYRTAIVPAPAVYRLARVFAWLFSPLVLLLALGALVAFDVWLLFEHGVAASLRSALYEPVIMLGLFAAVIAATAWHEIGHATACRYGGARPGVLGAGIYLVWPAFYCDVTDAYRLSRRGRLRTDLGGIYFNGLFSVAVAGVFLATGFEPLVLVILGQHLIVLQQLIPALRFDGYYVLSDMTGVPDILGRIKPILASLVPGRKPGPRVTELKPWVRRVVATYVVLLVPTLLGLLVVLVMTAPRIFATAYDSLGLQVDRIGNAVADGAVALAALGVLQMVTLVLPCLAIVLTASRLGRRAVGGLFGWAAGSAGRMALATAGTLAVAGFAAWTWWPNGDYEPIRPGERGTLSEVAASVTAIPSGRPAWTPERERKHGSEPTVRARRAEDRGTIGPVGEDERQVAPPSTTTTPAEESTTTTTPAAAPEPAPEEAPTETTPAAPTEEPAPEPAAPVQPPPAQTTPVPPAETTTVPAP